MCAAGPHIALKGTLCLGCPPSDACARNIATLLARSLWSSSGRIRMASVPKLAKEPRNSEMNPTHPAPGTDKGSEKDGLGRSSMANLAEQEVSSVLLTSTEMQPAASSDCSDGEDSGDMRLLDLVMQLMLAFASGKMVVSQAMSSLATRAHTAAVQDGEARLALPSSFRRLTSVRV